MCNHANTKTRGTSLTDVFKVKVKFKVIKISLIVIAEIVQVKKVVKFETHW